MTVYLELHFRTWLFCKAYQNAGGSLGNLGKYLGYRGPGKNGPVRNMWTGKNGIPERKLGTLCKIAKISESEIMEHAIPKEKSIMIQDWVATKILFYKHKKPSPEIFYQHNEYL